jgi:hypothetical protein
VLPFLFLPFYLASSSFSFAVHDFKHTTLSLASRFALGTFAHARGLGAPARGFRGLALTRGLGFSCGLCLTDDGGINFGCHRRPVSGL